MNTCKGNRLLNFINQVMKNTYKIILITLFTASTFTAFSQQLGPTIAFVDKTHNFGDIKEQDGVVTHDFTFTNTGNKPLIISRVTASCGCTTPTWTKKPVAPGEKGFIKVAYNPRNRPNKFNKSVSVYTNAQPQMASLRIIGNVIPKPRTIEDDYPYLIGPVRYKSNHFAFVKVMKSKPKTMRLAVMNTSDRTQKISFEQVPAHLKLKAIPETLKPNEKGVIEGAYDAGLVNDWGFKVDRVLLVYNDDNSNKNNRLTISATISEDFGTLTPEALAKAPKIEFKEKVFNFGKMKQKTSVEHEFVFTNTGKSDLMIRKVSSSCGCTAVSPKEKTIKPGQSSSIKAIFSSGTRVGRQNKSITVITNDPKSTTVILRVSGEVEAPPSKSSTFTPSARRKSGSRLPDGLRLSAGQQD